MKTSKTTFEATWSSTNIFRVWPCAKVCALLKATQRKPLVEAVVKVTVLHQLQY